MPKTLKDEIIEQVSLLEAPQQRKVLDFARALGGPAGTPGRELLRFAGSIDSADLVAISQAIEEACERVEPNGW
jgi:hypothetical protein